MDDFELRRRFDAKMLQIYEDAKRECGYNATRYLEMLSRLKGVDTAKRLLAYPTPSDGFTSLLLMGRVDLTVEALVVQEPWCRLFTDEELTTARARLPEART